MPLHDLSGGRIRYEISEKYSPGFDLLIGENDSLKFLKRVPDKSVKLIVTSPPYNIGKVYEERVKLEEYLKLNYNAFLGERDYFSCNIFQINIYEWNMLPIIKNSEQERK